LYLSLAKSKNGGVRVHIDLPSFPIHLHGTALSRVTEVETAQSVITPDSPEAGHEGKIKNVAYSEVFSDTSDILSLP
jgi:hypothetical protein